MAAAGAWLVAVLLPSVQAASAPVQRPAVQGTAATLGPGAGEGTGSVVFHVDPGRGRRPISPLIYGLNLSAGSPQFGAVMAEARPGMLRLGGNRWTAYNWENNDSNAGSDWQFQNDDLLASSAAPAAAVLPTVRLATRLGIPVMVTVPIAGYVSADRNPPGPVMNSGPGYLASRFKLDAPAAPRPLTLAPTVASRYVYQDQFVYFLTKQVPGAHLLFSLDNEPDLWDSTHREIHPQPTTYAELSGKDLAYARAIKAVSPAALVTGPVSYGWEGYLTLQNAPGSATYGDFLDWWMRQVRVASTKAGVRLVDDLDLHWYPEATGAGRRIVDTGTSPGEVAAREQAPRSLWDPAYVEKSWITQWSTGGKSIELLPRLQAEIAANNPGMNLDITEWDYGAGGDISGGIATADVLGIFGRSGVHAAAFWPLGTSNAYAYGAFAAFRNYDGHGSAFGGTEVEASTSDRAGTSVYASVGSRSSVVVVAINKGTSSRPAQLDLTGSTATRARVYVLTEATPRPVPAAALVSGEAGRFQYLMPAQSVSVIVVGAGSGTG